MMVINKILKPKKFVGKQIKICLNCGSEKITNNKFTIFCHNCGVMNFYEVT